LLHNNSSALALVPCRHASRRVIFVFGIKQANLPASGSSVSVIPRRCSTSLRPSYSGPGLLIVPQTVVVSLVWAFLPFKFAMTVVPALFEMHTACTLCREELLCESKESQSIAQDKEASADNCIHRITTHIAAASIACGRSSEVYGLVIPVRRADRKACFFCFHFCGLVTTALHCC
jgi:hypothetical protein